MREPAGLLGDDELRAQMAQFFDVLALVDEKATVTHITMDVEAHLGHPHHSVIGQSAFAFIDEADHHRTASEFLRELEGRGNRSETFTVRFRHLDGSWRDMEVCGTNRMDELGGLLVGMRDVTGRRLGDRVLAAGEHLYTRLPTVATDLTIITDASGKRIYVSPSVGPLLGYAADELVDLPWCALVHADDRVAAASASQRVLGTAGASETFELRLQRRDGHALWFEVSIVNLLDDRSIRGVVVHARNVDDRHRTEAQLRYRAMHDPLTGLLNRFAFLEILGDIPHPAPDALGPDSDPRHARGTAVLFCDLDGFKQVNDVLGHMAGDEVLVHTADRLLAAVRPIDCVARLGGDEFCVVCRDLADEREAIDVAERVRAALAAPLVVAGAEVHVGVSIGVAWTDSSRSGESLLEQADRAMYAAKSAGRDAIRLIVLP
jgi:diguanylate cyclase (GGDEF)-like protein/PAS domain S-box-containing protein